MAKRRFMAERRWYPACCNCDGCRDSIGRRVFTYSAIVRGGNERTVSIIIGEPDGLRLEAAS